MRKHLYLIILFLSVQFFDNSFAQTNAPAITWQKTLGGNGTEVLTAMCVGADKSVVLCGYSNSSISGNKSAASFGGNDYWVVKLDPSGNVVWNKTYGGSDDDKASAIIATSDGCYLLGGTSKSDKSGNKTSNSFEFSHDYWVLKLDANGNILWDRTLGGTYKEILSSLTELSDGTYIVGGYSYSNISGTKTTDNRGSWTNADYWTVILNKDGTEKTQFPYGGIGHDILIAVAPVGKSSFYAIGHSYSAKGKGKNVNPYGNNDYYVIRSNLKGQVEYEGVFGGTLSDYLTSMQVLPDSSVIMAGYSNSSKGKSKSDNFYGVTDYWLVKMGKDGIKKWDKTFSGRAGDGFGGDYLMSVQQTKDKGFILGGYSNAAAGLSKTQNSKGSFDYWIVKVDSMGKLQWDKTIGGSGKDMLTAIYELDSARYIVAGTSSSPISGDKTAGVIGGGTASDYWVMQLDGTATAKSSRLATTPTTTAPAADSRYKLEVMPNPVKEVLTVKYQVAAAKGKASLVVYAANGKAVLQSSLVATAKESVRSFPVAKLSAGTYFAVLYADGVKLTAMFNKE